MAFAPITSWQIDGKKMATVTDFISLGSKITADGDCSHEISTEYSSRDLQEDLVYLLYVQ